MKKKICSLFLTVVLLPCFAQKVSKMDIDDAIRSAATEIAELPEILTGGDVAIAFFSSPVETNSEYLENTMFQALQPKLRAKNVGMRDLGRNKFIIDKERDYQYSGAVDESTIVGWGKEKGVRYIVYGSISQIAGGAINFIWTLTDVETRTVPAMNVYEIIPSKKVSNLLGPERELNTISDYREVLLYLSEQKTSVENKKIVETETTKNAITQKYLKQIQEIEKKIREEDNGWTPEAELRVEIKEKTAPLVSNRESEIKFSGETIANKFSKQLISIDNDRKSVIKKLEQQEFWVESENVVVGITTKPADSTHKRTYFSYSINSTDEYVRLSSFQSEIDVSDRVMYNKILTATNNKTVKGKINYSLKQRGGFDSSIFDVIILSAVIFDEKTEQILDTQKDFSSKGNYNKTLNLSGKTTTNNKRVSSSVEKTFPQPTEKPTVVAKSNEEVEKTNDKKNPAPTSSRRKNKGTTSGSKTSKWDFTEMTKSANSELTSIENNVNNEEIFPTNKVQNGTSLIIVNGRFKLNNGLQAGKKDSAFGENAINVISLNFSKNSTIEVLADPMGSTNTEDVRTLYIIQGKSVVAKIDGFSSSPASDLSFTIKKSVSAGECKIFMNGCRIRHIYVTTN